MAEKCVVRDGKFVDACGMLNAATEYGHPRGKRKGVFAWALHIGREPSRTFYGVKSGEYVQKGIALNYCPFCGVKIDTPFAEAARTEPEGGNNG